MENEESKMPEGFKRFINKHTVRINQSETDMNPDNKKATELLSEMAEALESLVDLRYDSGTSYTEIRDNAEEVLKKFREWK
jgi:hypothetical protein